MEKRLMVKAGAHARRCCPVSYGLKDKTASAKLVDADTGTELPCQIMESKISWVVDDIPAGGEKEYVLKDETAIHTSGVMIKERDQNMDVFLNDALFATYQYGNDLVRPFLNPVIGPTGTSLVRELFEPDVAKEHDHIHHRGILVAHGDVNGTDNWSENNENCGKQLHAGVEAVVSGPVYGKIAVENDWVSAKGDHLLFERREMVFWNIQNDVRIIDFHITFRADIRDIVFGDTKEGGILSVRVPTALRVDRGGIMQNAYGGIGEKECWGKRAHWCDYFGTLEGQQVGIAVFDDTSNFRHPTYWHIRDYGLFAANPFALSYYYGDKQRNGSHTIKKGSTFPFAYRVYIHKGDTDYGKVGQAYHNYVNAPEIVED